MTTDIAKICADCLREAVQQLGLSKLGASHAHELVAAFFGYNSRAALLADANYSLARLKEARVMLPDIERMNARRANLSGLPEDLPASTVLARIICDRLRADALFDGEVWIEDTFRNAIEYGLLQDYEYRLYDKLSGVMAETNAQFDETIYDSIEWAASDDEVVVEVSGVFNGSSDPERPFSGDRIDMHLTITLTRVAGKTAFDGVDLYAKGEVNDDWYEPVGE